MEEVVCTEVRLLSIHSANLMLLDDWKALAMALRAMHPRKEQRPLSEAAGRG